MVAGGFATTADDAVAIGRLLADQGHIRHVTGDRGFKNGHYFYRFAVDEPERYAGGGAAARSADGTTLSWGALQPAASGGNQHVVALVRLNP